MKHSRLIAGTALLLVLAAPVFAELRAPTENISVPIGEWLPAGSYDEEIGSVAILSDENIMRVDDVYACDPLSNYGLLMDTNGKVAELHYVHSEFEKEEEYSWKVNVGSERSGVPTIEYVAQSYETHTQQTLFQFGDDGYIWFCGERSDVEYPDLLTDFNCPFSASALEIKVRMYPENALVTFQVINRGITTRFNQLYGPYPLIPEIAAQGIDRCIVKSRPNSGIAYMDGVICQGNSLALPPPETGKKVITRNP